ncbi:MAG TPA: hypothetical protein VFM37_14870 [Pseudonocardiaceae bacterium]|nr:hypothetical protein [Pseudonocardiaceae bacterium]
MSVPARNLTRAILVSLLTCGLSTALAVAVNFATAEGAGVFPWIAVVFLTLMSALLALFAHTKRDPIDGYRPAAPPYGQYPPWPPPRSRPARRPASAAAVLLVILLIAVLTGGVAYGGWYATAWLTGTESGADVLAGPYTVEVEPLTITIDAVEVTRHLTKVDLTVVNRSGHDTITLPLFGNCTLNAGGSTMGTLFWGSDWQEAVPPGGERSVGTIVFNGRPAPGATTATLRFAHTFGSFDLDSVTVPDIPLSVLE